MGGRGRWAPKFPVLDFLLQAVRFRKHVRQGVPTLSAEGFERCAARRCGIFTMMWFQAMLFPFRCGCLENMSWDTVHFGTGVNDFIPYLLSGTVPYLIRRLFLLS